MLQELLTRPEIPRKEIVLKRNDFLIREGETNTHLYFIKEGSLLAYILVEDEEQVIRFGYSGDFVAAIDSFISEKPTRFFFRAVKKSVLTQISKKTLMDWYSKDTGTMKEWVNVLQTLSLQQLDREIDLLTTSPKARYERVLERSPRLFQEIPHRYIANYLRMTPETLSRLKKS